uniref:FYVE-type domain-containing protein n=1 Tax=Hyaloperonospora arabidopsidis (strain Emoy2) TaxID=559515 RepID=M4BTV8_HYAAE
MTSAGSTSLGGVPRIHFTPERRARFEATSDDLVERALTVYQEFHRSKPRTTARNSSNSSSSSIDCMAKRWKLVKRKKSLNIYRERDKGTRGTHEGRTYLCSGVMPGTVEDMVSGAYADETEDMRIATSIVTTNMCLDARVVHVFDRNPVTSSVVFSGIKWMALKMPTSSSLIHDRDLLYYNRLGRIVDCHGRYFVYCVMDSIELDEVPADCQHNLKRGTVSLCHLFRQVQEELVGCFVIGSSSMGGTLPRSVGELITAERMLCVGNFLLVARAKAYSARAAQNAERLPSTSNSCDVCMKKPNLLSGSFKLCLGCRRNTCRKCHEWCTVFRLDLRSQKPGKERFCTQCISDVTRLTMSTFYICSLNESTSNNGSQYQHQQQQQLNCGGGSHYPTSTSVSMSTSSAKQRNSPLTSSQSQGYSEIDSDAWIPAPADLTENLDGLANFVERASLANEMDMQWNQDELDYYSDVLRESGHFTCSQVLERSASSTNRRVPSSSKNLHMSTSLPVLGQDKFNRRVSRSCLADENLVPLQKCFSVDELD